MTNLQLILVITMLLPKSLFAEDLTANVVKVRSRMCHGSQITLKGSGYGFTYGGRYYVLTSEHVVLASNGDEFCHSVTPNNGNQLKSSIWSLNWWQGVAILKIEEESFHADWPDLMAMIDALHSLPRFTPGQQVVMAGFPHENNLIFVDKGASLVTLAGHRNSIPGVEKTIEVRGVVERGMSGGPMLDPSGTIYGVISHQYLQPVAGGASYVETFGTNTLTISNHLIIIPFTDLIPWLTDSLDQPQPQVAALGIRKDPYAQLAGKDIIFIGETKITFSPGTEKLALGMTPGAGDGVGTGGTAAAAAAPGSSGTITVTHHSDSETSDEISLPGKIKSCLKDLERMVARRRKGDIDTLIIDRKPKRIHSLGGFFNQLNAESAFAAVEWSVSGLPMQRAKKVAARSLTALAQFSAKVERLETQEEIDAREIVAVKDLFGLLSDVFQSTDELGRIVYSVEELEQIKANTLGWNWFIAHDFTEAVNLRSDLEALIDIAQNEQL